MLLPMHLFFYFGTSHKFLTVWDNLALAIKVSLWVFLFVYTLLLNYYLLLPKGFLIELWVKYICSVYIPIITIF